MSPANDMMLGSCCADVEPGVKHGPSNSNIKVVKPCHAGCLTEHKAHKLQDICMHRVSVCGFMNFLFCRQVPCLADRGWGLPEQLLLGVLQAWLEASGGLADLQERDAWLQALGVAGGVFRLSHDTCPAP